MTRIKTISSAFINDPSISMGAKGLYFYINSKKPLWTSNAQDMSCETKTTPEDIEAIEIELIEHGYMERGVAESREGNTFYTYTLLRKTLSKIPELDRQNAKKVIAYWNAKGIVVHKVITPPLQYQIEKTLQLYSYDDICLAIDNYTQVYKSKITYWEHKWTLEEFLKRSGGMGVFLYKTEKDFIDKAKIGTAAAKVVILAEKKEIETDEQREKRLQEAEAIKYEQELREYFGKLKEDTKSMIIANAIESIKEKEDMKETHPYLYDMLKKQAIKRATIEYRGSKYIS